MVLMFMPSEANHACSVKLVRLKGSPEAKLKKSTANRRLSRSACSSLGLVDSVKGRQEL